MIVALDGSASGHAGLTVLDRAGGLVGVTSIVMLGSNRVQEAVEERMWPWLEPRLPAAPVQVWLERCPPTVGREKREKRRGQAAIGFPIGLVSGFLAATVCAYRPGSTVTLVDVSPWRATMQAHLVNIAARAPRKGPRADRGRPVRSGDGWTIGWRSCGHTVSVSGLTELARVPDRCPTCGDGAPKDATERWKRQAWDFASQQEPEAMSEVLDKAVKAARTEHAHPVRYAGVADAAESFCIAFHAWKQGSGDGS